MRQMKKEFDVDHCGTQKLETERLVLRRLVITDADAMYRN